jgi:hypothetical protein
LAEYKASAGLAVINNTIPKELWTGRDIAMHTETVLLMHGYLPQSSESKWGSNRADGATDHQERK